MSLMPNAFLQANDIIRMTSSSCNSYNISIIKSQTFFFWPKNKGPLPLSKFFPYVLFFPSTKFWSSYIAWFYIKRTKLHTKEPSLWSPLGWSLLSLSNPFSQIHLLSLSYAETSFILLQNTHFHTSPSLLQSPSL